MSGAWPLLLALLGPAAGDFPDPAALEVVDGVLVEADFLHRSGQLRRAGDGVLVDFALPASGVVLYRGDEADLRDVPLGTLLHASTLASEKGERARVAMLSDDFTAMARAGRSYRVEEVEAGCVVASERPSPTDSGRVRLAVDDRSKFWKGHGAVKLADLSPGDDLLVNRNDAGGIAEAWAGAEARRRATEAQRAVRRDFLRRRGLAARIDRVEGRRLAVTLLGDPESLAALMKSEEIDPARWATEGRGVDAVVANDELRTYNPPVDRKRAKVVSYEALPPGPVGRGGVRWVIEPDILLEGFRKGSIVRLFAHPSWPVEDMPFGECLYSEAPDARPDRVDPNLYPYRIDSGNEHLPWYHPKPGEFPPFHSHHEVVGELLEVGGDGRSGRFRADRTGEVVAFAMPPHGSVRRLGVEADLGDIPAGTRCRFFLHPDDRGEFTRASVVLDEASRLVGDRLSYRLDAADLGRGTLALAVRHALVKNDKEEMIRPPDFGRGLVAVDDRTLVWKDDRKATLGDLSSGDEVIVNTTGRTATGRGVCTEVWAGAATFRAAAGRQKERQIARVRERGLAARIDRVEGKRVVVSFFWGDRREYPAILGGDPGGKVYAVPADDALRPRKVPATAMAFVGRPPESEPAGTYGAAGVRWTLESPDLPDDFRPGGVVRIFRAAPPGGE